jgi:hypothetical protein
MAGYWPKEDSPVGPYGATKIAVRALDTVIQGPSNAGAGLVFGSAVDMVTRDIADPSAGAKFSAAAAGLWLNDAPAVASQIEGIAQQLTADDIASLLTTAEPDEARMTNLRKVVTTLTARRQGDLADIALLVLGKPAVPIAGQPDGALALWLDALDENLADTVDKLLASDLNDEQLTRVVQYILAHASALGLPFFLTALPALLEDQGHPNSVDWITSRFGDLSVLTPTRTEKSPLAMALIAVLPSLSGENLSRTAGLIGSLGGKGALEKRHDVLDRLDASQVQILSHQLPASTVLADRAKSAAAE